MAAPNPPFIKNEPDDQSSNPNQFMMTQSAYGIPSPSSFGNQFGGAGNDGIDPSELTMQHGGFMSNTFGTPQNLSSSFNLGNAGIDTSELLDLEFSGQNGMPQDHHNNNVSMVPDQRQPTALSMGHQGQMAHVYSETPEGAPIQSPFLRGSFNYEQVRHMQQQQQHTPHASSPHTNNVHFDQNYHGGKPHFKTRPMQGVQ